LGIQAARIVLVERDIVVVKRRVDGRAVETVL